MFDGNDMKNMSIDLHRVAKVVDDQVVQIKDAVTRANDAVDQANKAIDSSNVNKAAIDAANSAVAEAKQSASDAVQKLQSVESAVNTTSDEVTKVKQSQADQIKQVTNQISDAVTQAKAAADSLDAKTTALQTAVKNAQSDATVATQTASEANLTAINAASDAATAKITASGAAVTATNAQSDVVAIQATASAATITAGNAASDALIAKATASSANLTATNASSDVAQVSAAADSLSTRVTTVEGKTAANSTAIDENAKAITLKADQTSVGALKTAVTDNSAAVSVLNDEIKLKVDSTTVNNIVDGKGYATTSTVQSLITQKAGTINESITKLSNDTVTHFQSITASLDGLQTNVTNYQNDTTSKYTQLSNLMQSKVGTPDFEQLKRSVDMQTLDSADINNMKTNGHYFVHNLTNSPIAGWVYVDVTGNGADRIRQDVYQDNGNQHKYRRWVYDSWTAWSQDASESEITQLRDDINLRVTKGDLISQINLEAGGDGLISIQNGKGKLMLDADSVVFGNKAFIPSAYITDINADKIKSGTLDAGNVQIINLTADHIKGGTLDVGNMNIRNFSANDIEAGTLSGVTIKVGDNNSFFQTSGDSIIWKKGDSWSSSSVIGTSTYSEDQGHLGLTIADTDHVQISTWPGAYAENGKIIQQGGYIGHPRIMVENGGMHWDPDEGSYSAINDATDNANRVLNWVDTSEYFWVTEGKGAFVHLNESLPDSQFRIQKDNKIGAYFGTGDEGNRIEITSLGGFNLMNNTGIYSEDPNVTSTISNLIVDKLHVKSWFGDDGYKHSTVKTSQGLVGINAYETAEYYFGDIGESNTGSNGQVIIGIDHIFNETVNTNIQYQVFITPYSSAHIWVEKRYTNRFVVKSDQPNAEFGWEIKAKRKGYERTRLQNFDNVMPQVKRSK